LIQSAQKVFVLGVGHSGAIGKTFCMKLAHIGIRSYSVFDEIIPPFDRDTLLIAISQSGETTTVVSLAEKAVRLGGRVLAITGNRSSILARIANALLVISPLKANYELQGLSAFGNCSDRNVRGAVFGYGIYVVGYSLVVALASLRNESSVSIDARHATLE